MSATIGLSANHFAETPLPLNIRLQPFREGDITVGDLKIALDGGSCLLLDARLPESFHQSHLPGALNLPLQDFETHYQALKKELGKRPIIVYCNHARCPLSDRVKLLLEQKGHTDVSVFRIGIQGWSDLGLPVEGESK